MANGLLTNKWYPDYWISKLSPNSRQVVENETFVQVSYDVDDLKGNNIEFNSLKVSFTALDGAKEKWE